jgi:hypothetical protein
MPVFNPPGGPPGPPVQFGPAQTNDDVNGGYGYSGTGTFEEDRYFYHHDHLGSSYYLTNQLGNITQHVEYIPFGEVFVEEKTISGTHRICSTEKSWMRKRGCTIMVLVTIARRRVFG